MDWDTVIVGAGSAGATLAARLAADPSRQVLLIEAGPDWRAAEAPTAIRSPNPSTVVTSPAFAAFRFDDLTARRTRAQPERVYWRGRGLGGSSTINGQIAIRATAEDIERWAATGCTGWSFPEVLPYFCRLEADLAYAEYPYHGATGPIPIHRATLAEFGPVDLALAEAALDAGVRWAPDHNAPGAFGVSPYAINSRDGRRVSTNDAYLEPLRGANNLVIRTECQADQIVIEGERAVGVEYVQSGQRARVRGRQIVLAAGAVHSPCVLIRSGIGPADTVRRLGLRVVADLPVGVGLQDHPLLAIVLRLRPDAVPEPGFRHTNCCVRVASGDPAGGSGDLMFVSMNRLGDSLGRRSRTDDPPAVGMLGVWLNRCHSRGRLVVSSLDPFAEPSVDINMLDEDSDRRRLRSGVRQLLELAEHRGVARVAAERFVASEGWSGSRHGALTLAEAAALDDAALDALLLHATSDAQHATSTCRMGGAGDDTAVVDPECRVRGLEGLFVVDASVMPEVPCANTHLTTVMIAERMADRLRVL